MDKETSNRVSSIAAKLINITPAMLDTLSSSEKPELEILCAEIRALAGSALSQDETSGQEPRVFGFINRLKAEHAHLSEKLDVLTTFIGRGMPNVSNAQQQLLSVQHGAMTVYLRILQMRLADLENDNAG